MAAYSALSGRSIAGAGAADCNAVILEGFEMPSPGR
ncbi:hypothetical protein EV641_1442 [Rhodococcus sp. SMB37]|nr:hypothetical protein EV641_1442 [Rhodococcus sp. SMB37]